MFEDYCLACGKELVDGRAYCNDDCQAGDSLSLSSPSISSTSSAVSSPYLQYTQSQNDVPPLVLSLGRALRKHSASSSSSAWSETDDDDTSASEFDSADVDAKASALLYTRKPSGTNNRSGFLYACASISGHSRTTSTSASSSSAYIELPASTSNLHLSLSAPASTLLYESHDLPSSDTEEFEDSAQPATITSISTSGGKRRRNRASLPACFSLLQIGSSSPSNANAPGISPISSSSEHTLSAAPISLNASTRPSPPTPKMSLLASAAIHVVQQKDKHHTPRGRRQLSSSPSSSARSSLSRSPSPSRRRDSDEKVSDWSTTVALERGRATRRNSTPPTKFFAYAGSPRVRLSISPRLISMERQSRSRARSRSHRHLQERGHRREVEPGLMSWMVPGTVQTTLGSVTVGLGWWVVGL
ncbi:unnamed protein product [Mycena citricolor]|uniref:Uncharacterized protein n=1 Tax=Mycena citricolor TaxID=2018698 RepID=A0AAD2HNN6_9AGAR|nr:unnamed protein product [Mycena citricolor]